MILGADIVRFLLSTGGLILVFLTFAIWMNRDDAADRRSSPRARRLLLVYAVAVTLFSLYGLEYLFARAIVGGLKPFQVEDVAANKRTAVVVLGSGSWRVQDWDGRTAVYPDPAAATRVLETARVFGLVNPDVVVSSGGNPHPDRPMVAAGDAMRNDLIALGVPADRILVETESATTREEAVVVDRIIKARQIEQVVLVTSEAHMRRSLGVFRSVGIAAVPAIALEFLPAQDTWVDLLLPSQRGLDRGSENVHEMLGLTYYWLRGWHK